MENGDGLKGLIPPLEGSDYLQKNYNDLSCIIKYGIQDTIEVNGITYENPMEGVPQLTEIQISNLINYIRDRWYPSEKIITPAVIKDYLETCR
jgi:mono/diheme cytochrome c family protein